MHQYRIAVMPGDGIGPEVIREGVKALEAAREAVGGFRWEPETLPAGAGEYLERGKPLPDATVERARAADAVLLGAMGLPDVRWPDGTEMVPQVELRFQLDLYAGMRPVRWYTGVPPVLAQKRPEDVDFVVVRESTEGLFASLGCGVVLRDEMAVDQQVITRKGTERVCRAAFEWARRRARERGRSGKVTCVDKANIFRSSAFFRKVFDEVAAGYPDIAADHGYVDATAMRMVRQPELFDVMVTENMFGDILTDEASVLAGSMGMLPSASLGESRVGLYEPIHGSAPDIAGKGIANPIGMILSTALLLRHSLELETEAAAIEQAVDATISAGARTADLGGKLTTTQMADAIIERL